MVGEKGIFSITDVASYNKLVCVIKEYMICKEITLFVGGSAPMCELFSSPRHFHKDLLPKIEIEEWRNVCLLTGDISEQNTPFGVDENIEQANDIEIAE